MVTINKSAQHLAVSQDGETVGAIAIVPSPDHSYDKLDGKWLLDTENSAYFLQTIFF